MPELTGIPEEQSGKYELHPSESVPATKECVLESWPAPSGVDADSTSADHPIPTASESNDERPNSAPESALETTSEHSNTFNSSELSSPSSVFSIGTSNSTQTTSSNKSDGWRYTTSLQELDNLVDSTSLVTGISWVREFWQNVLPSPELINVSFLDLMSLAADCLSASRLRRSGFDLYTLCFRACYHRFGRELPLRFQPDSGRAIDSSEGSVILQLLLRCAIGSARTCKAKPECHYAIKLLEVSVCLLDFVDFAPTHIPRALLRLYQLFLVDKFPSGTDLTSRARDLETMQFLSPPVVSQEPLAIIHPAIRHREYLFLASQTTKGSFGRDALRIELDFGFPIANKRASNFRTCGYVRAKAHDFLRWCFETISKSRLILDGACPTQWPLQTDDKTHRQNLEDNAHQALFWLLVKEEERSSRSSNASSPGENISSARDCFNGFGLNTLDAFTVMVKIILNGTTCGRFDDRTDAMLIPDKLLIPDSLSNYCLRKIQMMGVSTFAEDYLDRIVHFWEPGQSDFSMANTLGARYFRSLVSDTPFPQALSILNSGVDDPSTTVILQAVKALNVTSQKPSWRQILAERRHSGASSELPDDTLAPSLLSARSSSQMSLETRSFLGAAYNSKFKRWTGSFRMSLSSGRLSFRSTRTVSVDSMNSFTRNTGMPHAPPAEPETEDPMGGWEVVIEDDMT